jgi:signal transduction histidine kinase
MITASRTTPWRALFGRALLGVATVVAGFAVGAGLPTLARGDEAGTTMHASPAAEGADAEPLWSITEILALPVEEFERQRPVVVRGIVTLVQPLVIQDGGNAIYLDHTQLRGEAGEPWQDVLESLPLALGAEVEVAGVVDPGGYAPWIIMKEIRRLGQQPLPEPVSLDIAQLFAGEGVGRRIRATGVVQAVVDSPKRWSLAFESASRRFSVTIAKAVMPVLPEGLVDAEVEVVGVGKSFRNTRGEFVAPGLYLARGADLRVIRGPTLGPFELPITPLGSIARYRPKPLGGHRVRTSGVVSFAAPGTLFLQDDIGGIEVDLAPTADGEWTFEPGDRVEVAGFPDMTSGIGAVTWAVARRISGGTPPPPLPIQPSYIVRVNDMHSQVGSVARPGSYDGCLIRCQGKLEAVNTSGGGALLTLTEGGNAFNARVASGDRTDPVPFVLGSELEITGIVQAERNPQDDSSSVRGTTSLSQVGLLVRDRGDIRVVRLPPWWTPGRLAAVAGLLGSLATASIVWVTFLRREVARQTARAIAEESARRQAALDYEITLRERNKLAGNLHDTALQTVTGIAFQLKVCEAKERERIVDAVGTAADDDVGRHLGVARKMVEHAADQLRGTVWSLRSLPNEGRSFSDALRELVDRQGAGHEARVRLEFDADADAIPAYVAGNLILVVQEAVHNALHHADPRQVEVSVDVDAAGGVAIEIRDDGAGFEVGTQAGPRHGHFGVAGMRERVERLGGTFEIESTSGRGTTVRAGVPPVEAMPAAAAGMYE